VYRSFSCASLRFNRKTKRYISSKSRR